MTGQSRLRTGDILVESGETGARWRVVDYWRDVVELECLDAARRRKFLYQAEITNNARYRVAGSNRNTASSLSDKF